MYTHKPNRNYHSDQMSISKDGLSAVKKKHGKYYKYGVVYSDRPLTGNCEFEVKLSGHENGWSGSLKLGIAEFPSGRTLKEFEIPKYSPEGKNLCVWSERAIMDHRMGKKFDVQYGDFYLPELREGDRVGLKITEDGVLSFFFNGKYQGVAARDVYRRGYDVYALVDHYGQAYASVITKASECIPALLFLSKLHVINVHCLLYYFHPNCMLLMYITTVFIQITSINVHLYCFYPN